MKLIKNVTLFLCLFIVVGCSSNKGISLNDHAVKTVKRNVVTMNLETGIVTNE